LTNSPASRGGRDPARLQDPFAPLQVALGAAPPTIPWLDVAKALAARKAGLPKTGGLIGSTYAQFMNENAPRFLREVQRRMGLEPQAAPAGLRASTGPVPSQAPLVAPEPIATRASSAPAPPVSAPSDRGQAPTAPVTTRSASRARPTATPGQLHFLGEFSKAEGTDETTAKRYGYASGYDVRYGYKRSAKPLTQMTLDEVAKLSGANGRYQVMAPTLGDFRKAYGLTGKELFSPELQDQIGVYLLNRRGYGNLKLSPEDLQLNMSMEWASIEDPKKKASHYTYKRKDKSGNTVVVPQPVKMRGETFEAALARARELDAGR